MFFASLLFLTALASGAYGVAVGVYRIWPFKEIRLISDELQFAISDITGGLDRQVLTDQSTALQNSRELTGASFSSTARPEIGLTEPLSGQTIVLGSFVFDNVLTHAALLLNKEGSVRHRWVLSEETILVPEKRGDRHKFIHGFVAVPDGSIVFGFDGGVSLQRFDACSRPVWGTIGNFHHAVTLTEDKEYVWSLLTFDPDDEDPRDQARRDGIALVSVKDGRIERSLTVRDLIDANPLLDVFGPRQLAETSTGYTWEADPLHSNDVDPLPASLAADFPMFEEGDLLLSYRSLNLVVVVDPDTYEIKWFTTGHMRRQHDPDWQSGGKITIYDNNMHRGESLILSFDPAGAGEPEIILDGGEIDFYSWQQGKHQITDAGTILVSSPQEGRVFETDKDGNVIFEMINHYDKDAGKRLLLSEAIRLPEGYFEEGVFDECES